MSDTLKSRVREKIGNFIKAMGGEDRENAASLLKEAIAARLQIQYDDVYQRVVEERVGLGRPAGRHIRQAGRDAVKRSNEPFKRVLPTKSGTWYEIATNFALEQLERQLRREFRFDLSTHRVYALSRAALNKVNELRRIDGYAIYDRATGEPAGSLNRRTQKPIPDPILNNLERNIKSARGKEGTPLTESVEQLVLEEMDHEEVVETWNDDKDGEYIQINDDGTVWYVTGGSAREQIPTSPEDPFPGIEEWMQEQNFYPNIWEVNDHGNVTLVDSSGNALGGIV